MPIYEYRCASCGAELEKLQKISDPPLVECPECGKETLVKLVSASSFRLKGSGWYETDFKTGKKKNGAGDNEGAASDAAPESAKESVGSDNGKDSSRDSNKEGSKDSATSGKDSPAETKAGKKAETRTDAKAGTNAAKNETKPGSDSAGAARTNKPAAKD